MKAHADSLTKPRWFRVVTHLGRALSRIHCAGSERAIAGQPAQWCRRVIVSAGVILVLTALAKFIAILSGSSILEVRDPIFGILFRHTMLLVGGVELVIAYVCVFGSRPIFSAVLVAWLGANFLVYRTILWWIGWEASCGCLGGIDGILNLPTEFVNLIINALAAWLLLGGGASIWGYARLNKR